MFDSSKMKTYQVTACDDTGIRSVRYAGLSLRDAKLAKSELLNARPRRWFNPRIRKEMPLPLDWEK